MVNPDQNAVVAARTELMKWGHIPSSLLSRIETLIRAIVAEQFAAHDVVSVFRPKRESERLSVDPDAPVAAEPQENPADAVLHPNTRKLVDRFAAALKLKLALAEQKYGYSDGWMHDDWMDECRRKLREHIEKGDPRDVAAYCAFLWHHDESTKIGPAPEPQAPPRRMISPLTYCGEYHRLEHNENEFCVLNNCFLVEQPLAISAIIESEDA